MDNNQLNSGSIETLKKGDTLLVSARKINGGKISLEADIKTLTYSKPEGVGREPVIFGYGNRLPSGVNPKNAVYKSLFEKLF